MVSLQWLFRNSLQIVFSKSGIIPINSQLVDTRGNPVPIDRLTNRTYSDEKKTENVNEILKILITSLENSISPTTDHPQATVQRYNAIESGVTGGADVKQDCNISVIL